MNMNQKGKFSFNRYYNVCLNLKIVRGTREWKARMLSAVSSSEIQQNFLHEIPLILLLILIR